MADTLSGLTKWRPRMTFLMWSSLKYYIIFNELVTYIFQVHFVNIEQHTYFARKKM